MIWHWLLLAVWVLPLLYAGLIWRGWAKGWYQVVRDWIKDIVEYYRP